MSHARGASAGAGEALAPRSRKGAETRARLLEAAKRVFEEKGFLDARISDISKRAGLSHGSFSHYFESKEQIFREVAEAEERLLTAPPATGRVTGSDPDAHRERIRRANRRYLERYRDEGCHPGAASQFQYRWVYAIGHGLNARDEQGLSMNQQVGLEATILLDRQIKMAHCLRNVRRDPDDFGHIRRVSFGLPHHQKHPRKTQIYRQEL